MSKRIKLKGTSARSGRAPAPYTKYKKRPYQYPGNLKEKFPIVFNASGKRLYTVASLESKYDMTCVEVSPGVGLRDCETIVDI